jgi:EAL domain-containing protein (putative c-di-GMP-specific phosphodiesterase class I)
VAAGWQGSPHLGQPLHAFAGDLGFATYAAEVLAAERLPARLLTVEITETALLQVVGHALEVCRQLRALGIGIALDDFGVGHSPVQYLRWFPVSRIKVDGSLVADLSADPQARTIVGALVRMARDLGIETVGEGVETPEMQRILNELGCDLAQGYLYAAPMPAAALATWARSHAAAV